jgi:hypothetical protein
MEVLKEPASGSNSNASKPEATSEPDLNKTESKQVLSLSCRLRGVAGLCYLLHTRFCTLIFGVCVVALCVFHLHREASSCEHMA